MKLPRRFTPKTIGFITLLCIIVSGVSVYWGNAAITASAEGKLYTDAQQIPYNKTGLLLGTSKFLNGGYINPYYQYRIDAAVELLKAGKIKYLVISGDNGTKEYNEPEAMRTDLINAGIDSTIIFLDYAGFRTFDSVVRLREIFSQDSATIISQPFHNERAIYISGREGIAAIGFNAQDVSKKFGVRIQVREKFARVKVFVDYLFGKEPKFLGPKVAIPT